MNADDLSYGLNQEIYQKSGKLWNDGWYLYSSGEVSGPYSAVEIFPGAKPSDPSTDTFLVSRKGLSRWYELGILRQIYRENSAFLRDSKQKTGHGKTSDKSRSKKQARVKGKVLGFQNKKSSQIHIHETVESQPPPQPKKVVKVTPSQKTTAEAASPGKKFAHSAGYYHLIYKGRLRLGNIQSPLHSGFTRIFVSLGFGLKTWYEQALVETTFHLDDPMVNARISRSWLVLIPGIHCALIYRLARLILQMEVQNHYKKTSPFFALFLSLIPPLAIFYLQKSMNRHWILHVAHAVDRQHKK